MTEKFTICGIVQLNSQTLFGKTKKGFYIKKFFPYKKYKDYEFLYVKCKKEYQTRNVYAIASFEGNQKDDIGYGTIEEFLGDVGNKENDEKYLIYICKHKWCNDKKFKNYELKDLILERNKIDCYSIYSIDPENCKDIDDAIHVKKLPNKKIEIGIHIADVSSFIPRNSDLDKELSKRCESIYLKNQQINMLPNKLVEFFSLTNGVEKNAFSLIINTNDTIDIIDFKIRHTKILVKKNLSYTEAENLVETDLKLMFETGELLYKKIFKTNNLLNFDTHMMVEAYMILANSLIAEYISKHNPTNVLLRCQNDSDNKYIYDKDIKDTKKILLYKKANNLLMSKASYSIGVSEKSTHMGLDIKLYTHFTSPIRRYADIINHRMTNDILENIQNKYNINIDQLNNIHTLNNYCEKLSNQLDLTYLIHEKFNDSYDTYGYVIGFDENKINIHINNKITNIDLTTNLYSNELKHLISVENKNNKLILTNNILNKKIEINLFQKIKLILISNIFSSKKLLIKIYYPNIRLLFDTDEYYDKNEYFDL